MISCLRFIHRAGYIHRDIKPDNILIDPQDHTYYLVDLGLATQYKKGLRHISERLPGSMTGTVPYMSLNTHQGIHQTRRDDFESLSYTLLYLLLRRLPWMSINFP